MSMRWRDELRGFANVRLLALLHHCVSYQSHDSCSMEIKPMSADDVIAQTPRGSTIQKTSDGFFLVCNSENQCLFTRSLYLAEQELDGMEEGYQFPYSTSFRNKIAWIQISSTSKTIFMAFVRVFSAIRNQAGFVSNLTTLVRILGLIVIETFTKRSRNVLQFDCIGISLSL